MIKIKNQSLKFKLFIYYLIIQILLFLSLWFVMIHMLKESVKSKIQSNMKIVILDIKDDIIEHNKGIRSFSLSKELDEFQIKPLYIRIFKIDDSNKIEITKTTNHPSIITYSEKFIKNIEKENIYFNFDDKTKVVTTTLKFEYKKKIYIIQISTIQQHLPELFPDLNYILIFVAPIIILFSIIFGNILISRAFKPIENLLKEIQNIEAKSLSSRVTQNNTEDEIDKITKEINKLLSRVEKSYNQISQFTSDVSHELKTPLTILRGELEIVLNENRDISEYKQILKSGHDEVLNIQKIVEKLLLLSKVENKAQLNLDEIVYLDELIFEILEESTKLANLKNIKIKTDIKDFASIKGNEDLLKIAIKNILENSIFYSYNDSFIDLRLYTKADGLCYLEIQDYGIGMDKNDLNNIYEKFFRSDTSRSKHTGGSGLGMSIVKKICDIHQIKIAIQSKINKGTFTTLIFKIYE